MSKTSRRTAHAREKERARSLGLTIRPTPRRRQAYQAARRRGLSRSMEARHISSMRGLEMGKRTKKPSVVKRRATRKDAYHAARALGATRGAARHVYSIGALSRPPLVPTYDRVVHFQSYQYLNVVWVTIHCVPLDSSEPEHTDRKPWWFGSDHPMTWQELSAAVGQRIVEQQTRYERCFVLGFSPYFIQREIFQAP